MAVDNSWSWLAEYCQPPPRHALHSLTYQVEECRAAGRRPSERLFCVVAVLASICGCQRESPPADGDAKHGPAWLKDITAAVGLNFVHDAGSTGKYFLPQVIGSGAALFDFDQDGRLDLLLLQNGGPGGPRNKLYRQLPDGKFQDASAGSGLDFAGHNMGVAIGDVDNDGLPDVAVTQYRGVKLLLNQGKGRFLDVTEQAGLVNPHWGTSACFFDFDRDGWLDLIVVNYVDYDPSQQCTGVGGKPDFCHPRQFAGSVARLYRNLGSVERKAQSAERKVRSAERAARSAESDEGAPRSALRAPRFRAPRFDGAPRFQDVTIAAGLGRLPGPGLGVVCFDCDGDGWPDILVANDGHPNYLWVNQKNGTFREEAAARGIALNIMGQPQGNMGIAVGDLDGDGLLDFFITHLTEETHTLWKQGPRGYFKDQTAQAGLNRTVWRGTGFGTVAADFDHDGRPDLAVVNGRVYRDPSATDSKEGFWTAYEERNQLFANGGEGKFRDVSPASPDFTRIKRVGRGLACADIDGDGALDLLVTNIAGPALLYRNVCPNRGHWLMIRAVDPALKRDAYGAEITVRAGKQKWHGLVQPAHSYLCSSDPRVHFGLGATMQIDAIEVLWPDGLREVFAGGDVDRVVELGRGTGREKK